MNLDSLFDDGTLSSYIKSKNVDLWKDTYYEGYSFLSPKQKGGFGELMVERYMTKKGSVVLPKTNEGHDRIIDGFKTEIKFSLCNKTSKNILTQDYFFINHVSIGKDWDRLIFMGVNPNSNNNRILWFTKQEFIEDIQNLFANQQGGIGLGNDDFKLSGKIDKLLNNKLVKSIDIWSEK